MNNESSTKPINILKEEDAAKYIGMSRSFLRQDRMNGFRKNRTKGPMFIRIGRNIRYHIDDLNIWLQQKRIVR